MFDYERNYRMLDGYNDCYSLEIVVKRKLDAAVNDIKSFLQPIKHSIQS